MCWQRRPLPLRALSVRADHEPAPRPARWPRRWRGGRRDRCCWHLRRQRGRCGSAHFRGGSCSCLVPVGSGDGVGGVLAGIGRAAGAQSLVFLGSWVWRSAWRWLIHGIPLHTEFWHGTSRRHWGHPRPHLRKIAHRVTAVLAALKRRHTEQLMAEIRSWTVRRDDALLVLGQLVKSHRYAFALIEGDDAPVAPPLRMRSEVKNCIPEVPGRVETSLLEVQATQRIGGRPGGEAQRC
mmetsp:Transcript_31726/g.91118  ORF Transcript_31726/g.91118 Transcript_31726/m.91118 type:complete len:237 (+) Transcript_31726:1052-1762(+)